MSRTGTVTRWIAMGLASTGLSVLIVPLMLVVGAGTAWACTCAQSSEQAHYNRADVVFEGRLVDRQEPPQRPVMSTMDPATLTFEVTTVYKGQADATQRLTTAQGGASCGLGISGEGPLLVFANFGGPEGLVASLCGGTRALADAEPAFTDATPSPPTAIADTEDITDPLAPFVPAPQAADTIPPADGTLVPAGVLAAAVAAAIAAIPVAQWVRLLRRRDG